MKKLLRLLRNLLGTQYYWVKVNGIFRDGIYLTSPQHLYFTSVAVPVAKSDMHEFMNNPTGFLIKAIQDMHPEMVGFVLCNSYPLGWYYSDEFASTHPFNFREASFKMTPTQPNTEPKLKEVTVISRFFNVDIYEEPGDINGYISEYIKATLATFLDL